jgi:MFS family permease
MKRMSSPRVAVFLVFVASLFISIMDGTIVNVALSTISRDFGVGIAATDVIVVAYLVSLAVTIPVAGWVGDRWGSKRTFLTALGLFVVASALCGLSATLGQLVGAHSTRCRVGRVNAGWQRDDVSHVLTPRARARVADYD